MTTVVMKEHEGGVWAAWDTQATLGARVMSLVQPKVFVNGPFVFGVAGTLKGLMHIQAAKFDTIFQDESVENYLLLYMIPEIRDILKSVDEEPNEGGSFELDIVVGINGKLYDISGLNEPLQQTTGVYALGSGSDYALGALEMGATPIEAVQVAVKYDAFSGGPVDSRFWKW